MPASGRRPEQARLHGSGYVRVDSPCAFVPLAIINAAAAKSEDGVFGITEQDDRASRWHEGTDRETSRWLVEQGVNRRTLEGDGADGVAAREHVRYVLVVSRDLTVQFCHREYLARDSDTDEANVTASDSHVGSVGARTHEICKHACRAIFAAVGLRRCNRLVGALRRPFEVVERQSATIEEILSQVIRHATVPQSNLRQSYRCSTRRRNGKSRVGEATNVHVADYRVPLLPNSMFFCHKLQ